MMRSKYLSLSLSHTLSALDINTHFRTFTCAQLLETRVTSFTRNTEQAICAVYPGTQSTVNDELLKLTARWSDLKDQVRAASKNIDLTVEYFQLGDKVNARTS